MIFTQLAGQAEGVANIGIYLRTKMMHFLRPIYMVFLHMLLTLGNGLRLIGYDKTACISIQYQENYTYSVHELY